MRDNKKKFWGRLAGGLYAVMLTVVPVLIFYFVYRRCYHLQSPFYIRGYVLFVLLYAFLLILFMCLYGGYEIRRFRTRELTFSFALASALTNFIMYFVMCLVALKMINPLYEALGMLGQWAVEILLYVLIRIIDPSINPDINALYIHPAGDDTARIQSKFDRRRTRLHIRESMECTEPRELLLAAMDRHEAVIVGEIDNALRQELMGYCFERGQTFLLLPSMSDIMVNNAEKNVMSDCLIYALNTQGPSHEYLAMKRMTDVLLSLLGLVLVSPLLLLSAAGIWLYDRGPVFYRQTRLTEGGRRFELIKFRSMIVNAESQTGAVLAGKRDPRITPVGRILRTTRMDELPQLWNILRGDMSLVGPRPERPEFYSTICAEYPEFSYRLKMRAGLTGYAQLYGKYNTSFEDKARLDVYYIQRASLLRDIQLIFYTLKILFVRESTEGVERQTSAQPTETADIR